MQEESEGCPIDDSPSAAPPSEAPKRRHRPGLRRTQIACQRCRTRKHKCDGKLPVCTTCEKAGTPCTIVDRLSYRQYPRGHVEQLEAQVEELQQENAQLRVDLQLARQPLNHHAGPSTSDHTPHATEISQGEVWEDRNLVEDIGLLSLEGASERRYVGESSGIYFGKIMQALLPATDYKYQHGPPHSRLSLRVERRQASRDSPATNHSAAKTDPAPIPPFELANKLQETFFMHRWPALPFLHKPTFLERHFMPVMYLQEKASHLSLFLTYMVFALGALDLRRQKESLMMSHLDYFHTAATLYLDGLVETDDIETVQGFLLLSVFAVNEPRSMNAWMVSGLAVRSSIDLGLHRKVESPAYNLLQLEMRKRVFWAAYAMDRNISIALGRPLCIQDSDINVELPLPLSDQDLLSDYPLSSSSSSASLIDMSTFIHIIKLRQLGSEIQGIFYPPNTSKCDSLPLNEDRDRIRGKLEEWMSSAPRYTSTPVATFQSIEWFQIAYNHALLLLCRPSPASPKATSQALQTCADSSISLITLYLALYSKNKITYTWIALHSLFMASVTMLYTLFVPEIRNSTTKGVVESNIKSCLTLFDHMAELWPAAAHRCHQVIERLGKSTLLMFDETRIQDTLITQPQQLTSRSTEGHFPKINEEEYMDWFGTQGRIHPTSSINGEFFIPEKTQQLADGGNTAAQYDISNDIGNDMSGLDGLFQLGFDMSLPLMTDVFDKGITNLEFQNHPGMDFQSDATVQGQRLNENEP